MVYCLCDSEPYSIYGLKNRDTIIIEASEEIKTLSTVEEILKKLSQLGMKKSDRLTIVGGGCLQDLGTLAAALYMRGVHWDFWPTTLAAMGDSCIGGKSSINVGNIKNLVGNFYPPGSIVVHTEFVKSLPPIELLAGASEIVKICFAHSEQAFEKCLTILGSRNWQTNDNLLRELIFLSLTSKKYFIEIDEFDTAERKLLNFGHTFGHALESATEYAIPHGVAVLIGMIAATNHEKSQKSAATNSLQSICIELLKNFGEQVKPLLNKFNLTAFIEAIKNDKKNYSDCLTLILPSLEGLVLLKDPLESGAIDRAVSAILFSIETVKNEI